MKIALTTSGITLDGRLEPRFGRAPKFLIYDMNSNTFVIVDNLQNLNAAQGAGIQSADTIVRAGASALITGHCGPKAYRVLKAAGVKVYPSAAATISEAIDLFRQGKLEEASGSDVEGHWM